MQPPPADPPPPGYGQYYRPSSAYQGSSDRLQALADGYFGLNWAFLVNIILVLAIVGLSFAAAGGARASNQRSSANPALAFFPIPQIVLFIIVVLVTYRPNSRIAYGMGWSPGAAIAASLLIGLNSVFCCGVIGYIVMQMIAYAEMKKYGIKGSTFGIRKATIMEAIAQLKQQESIPPAATVAPPEGDR